jgi:hypothetical protein
MEIFGRAEHPVSHECFAVRMIKMHATRPFPVIVPCPPVGMVQQEPGSQRVSMAVKGDNPVSHMDMVPRKAFIWPDSFGHEAGKRGGVAQIQASKNGAGAMTKEDPVR